MGHRVLAAAAELAQRLGGTLVLYRAVAIPAELPTLALSKSPGEVAIVVRSAA